MSASGKTVCVRLLLTSAPGTIIRARQFRTNHSARGRFGRDLANAFGMDRWFQPQLLLLHPQCSQLVVSSLQTARSRPFLQPWGHRALGVHQWNHHVVSSLRIASRLPLARRHLLLGVLRWSHRVATSLLRATSLLFPPLRSPQAVSVQAWRLLRVDYQV